ncbi:MAG: GNAT family N-acetyltransferase [Clostridia bacterium]|nr:GNAT family N-acetyltransferase [Clostridia bacterium]
MISGKWFPQGADLTDVLSVRQGVFAQGVDALDQEAQSVVVYLDDVPAGAGRLWWREGSFWIGDLGVLPEYRGQKLGDLTLRLLLFKAQDHFAREVRLLAPEGAAGFFARLGFREDSRQGKLVEMMIPGDEIELDSCKACKKANCPKRKE